MHHAFLVAHIPQELLMNAKGLNAVHPGFAHTVLKLPLVRGYVFPSWGGAGALYLLHWFVCLFLWVVPLYDSGKGLSMQISAPKSICWSSSDPAPCLSRVNAQDHIQMSSEYLKGRRFHSFSEKPVPVLHHLHSFPFYHWATCILIVVPSFLGKIQLQALSFQTESLHFSDNLSIFLSGYLFFIPSSIGFLFMLDFG